MIKDALKLAQEIMDDFEKFVLPELDRYRETWRYQEVMQIIEELKTGEIKSHPKVNGIFGFGGDEFYEERFWPLQAKLRKLKEMLEEHSKDRNPIL